jgi:hypothetical protein
LFPCLWRMTNEHRHRALGKGQGKAGRHRPGVEAGYRFLGGPVSTGSFALEMSCVNSWSERKATETFPGVSLRIAYKLVRSGTLHAAFPRRPPQESHSRCHQRRTLPLRMIRQLNDRPVNLIFQGRPGKASRLQELQRCRLPPGNSPVWQQQSDLLQRRSRSKYGQSGVCPLRKA